MKDKLKNIPGDMLLVVLVVLSLLPFFYMVITSLQSTTALTLRLDFHKLQLNNYRRLFTTFGFGRALLTSVIVVTVACIINLVVCSLASYAFSKNRFAGSEIVYWIYIATMMVPTQVTLIPLYSMMRDLGLVNTYFAIGVPVINAFGVFLMRQFMDGIPDEIIEAARIDGASEFRIYLFIILPLVQPVMVALTIFTFITTWNDFMWPLVSISKDSMQTITVASAKLVGKFSLDYGLVMAGATVSFIVPFLVYVVLQRRFVQGIVTTGLK